MEIDNLLNFLVPLSQKGISHENTIWLKTERASNAIDTLTKILNYFGLALVYRLSDCSIKPF
ncbi:hypothetical protein HNQ00_002211 [Flavobacterium sp. 14A]|nr:hypothetical protein [Flavobacterium sp. 14A]